MKYSQLNKNNVYIGKVDGIPGDVPGSWYSPNNMCIEEDPPTDEPGKWKHSNGTWEEYTQEDKARDVRQERDTLLSATDYRMMPDYPMSELCRENLKLYRQLLRDIPEQPGFPNSVVWPIKGE